MKIKRVRLKDFKRFDDLTIELGDSSARIVALVGPNGCGKSSVFDAFEERQKDYEGANANETVEFFAKFMFARDPSGRMTSYQRSDAIQITTDGATQDFTKKSFHLRSPYRFTPKLNVSSITAQPNILDDTNRPTSSIAIDSRLEQNYQRMLGTAYDEFQKEGGPTGDEVRAKLLDRINSILRNVLDVEIASIGNVLQGRGQLYFQES
jgi:energy-coupling factor transporter ATP-binding protein EcfA2